MILHNNGMIYNRMKYLYHWQNLSLTEHKKKLFYDTSTFNNRRAMGANGKMTCIHV